MDILENLQTQIISDKTNLILKNTNKINDNSCYIVDCLRTPVTKALTGGLSKYSPEKILSDSLKALIRRNKFLEENKEKIDEIIIGNALQQGSGFVNGRVSEVLADLPSSVPLYSVNRLCNGGLQAIVNAHNAIECGNGDIMIAGGIESMSFNNFNEMLNKNQIKIENVLNKYEERINNIFIPMGKTNENICKKFNITREEQDLFSYNSHIKAYKAQEINKNFDSEIIAIEDCKKDECIRKNISLESMKKLKPAFIKNGTTTAGNSSPISDGCALCLLMNYKSLKKYNINKVLGKIKSYVSIGVDPELMGIGPSVAIPLLLQKNNLTVDDIDLFEINEAFAGQCLYCINKLKIPKNKVNLFGGAIAIGHPLGCSGARLIVTMLNQLKTYKKKLGIVSMCVGTGMGAAALIERCDSI